MGVHDEPGQAPNSARPKRAPNFDERRQTDHVAFAELVWVLVAATGWDSNLKVTVPVVAASVELGFRSAQVKIQVRGYDGDLGGLLPAPSALNVSSYAKYIAAFEKIQKKVMSDEANQKPVLLETRPAGYSDDES